MAERIATPDGARLLGQQIANARKDLRKSQEKLAADAGVERSLISRLEGGHFKTLNESVQKVCTTLGLDPRNPGGDQRIDTLLRRIVDLSANAPQLLSAIDSMLDALESAIQRQRRP